MFRLRGCWGGKCLDWLVAWLEFWYWLLWVYAWIGLCWDCRKAGVLRCLVNIVNFVILLLCYPSYWGTSQFPRFQSEMSLLEAHIYWKWFPWPINILWSLRLTAALPMSRGWPFSYLDESSHLTLIFRPKPFLVKFSFNFLLERSFRGICLLRHQIGMQMHEPGRHQPIVAKESARMRDLSTSV